MACDVASAILGRPAHAGTGSLHYAEALAWMKGEAAHTEFEHQLLVDLADLCRALGIEVFRMPWRECRRPTRQLDPFTFLFGDPDGAHEIFRHTPDTGDFGLISEPAQSPAGTDYETTFRRQIEHWEDDEARSSCNAVEVSLEHRMLHGRFGQEFFLVYNAGGIGVNYHNPEALMLVATNPDLVQRSIWLQARHAVADSLALARLGYPNVLVAGGDMAGNDGPFYSPAHFRAALLPPLKWAMAEMARIGGHYIFRTDGNMWPMADLLFGEAACPGYGEADRDCTMTLGKLRARFPRLVVWGNMSVSQLARQPLAWVKDEARRLVEESGGTAYFQGASNAIIKGTPIKNVEALFAART
jgi:hypothetical protein